jgi:hypothetical protein
VPEGVAISLGVLQVQDLLDSTGELFRNASSLPGAKGILAFSCLSRQMNLGFDEMGEVKLLEETASDLGLPWFFAYSGGEIIPNLVPDGEPWGTHFYNLTLVVMIF